MSNFELILIDRSNGELGAEVFFTTDKVEDIAKLRALAAGVNRAALPTSTRAGAKGRAVVVIGKPEESDSIFQPGDQWGSAYETSIALGYGYNAVAAELKKASMKGEKSVIIRGVELCYLEDMPGKVD